MVNLTVKEKIEDQPLYDVVVLHHGYAAHMRDYDVVIETMWGFKEWGDAKGRYLCRFTHCPEAHLITKLEPKTWGMSWDDVFTDYEAWMRGDEPEGFVWGVQWADGYPGFGYVEDSELAAKWSQLFGKSMHEVKIETNVFTLQLIFHDFNISKLSDEVAVVDKLLIPRPLSREAELS